MVSGEQAGEEGHARWRALARFKRAVRIAAFWLAVVLPLLYLPMLFSGLGSRRETVWLGAFLVTHVVALSLGHSHAADSR